VSVHDVEVPWSHRLEIFENNFTPSADPMQHTDLFQGEHPEILAGIGDGYRKIGFGRTKGVISLKHGKIGPRLLLRSNRSHICAFDWCKNQRPWMTLKGHYSPCFKTRAPWCCCYLFIFSFTFSLLLVDKWLPVCRCYNGLEANNNQRVIGRRKNMLHRAVSLR